MLLEFGECGDADGEFAAVDAAQGADAREGVDGPLGELVCGAAMAQRVCLHAQPAQRQGVSGTVAGLAGEGECGEVVVLGPGLEVGVEVGEGAEVGELAADGQQVAAGAEREVLPQPGGDGGGEVAAEGDADPASAECRVVLGEERQQQAGGLDARGAGRERCRRGAAVRARCGREGCAPAG